MATYASYSDTDKAIVQNITNLVRAAIGQLGKGWNSVIAIAADTNAVGLVTGLDAGQVIPNTCGLAGADDLTKEEVVALYTLLNAIRLANDTAQNRAAMSKAAGINALLG